MNLSIEQMFRHIVEMQCELNEKTVPNWLAKNLDWETAILVEVAEAIDSTDWKWWKHTETDLVNLKIEAIDLLHFLVAKIVDEKAQARKLYLASEKVVKDLVINYDAAFKCRDEPTVEILKSIAYYTIKGFTGSALFWLFGLFNKLEMDAQSIYKAYITKNLLNHYRQERGYKDPSGDYLKVINGREDNVVFAECIDNVLKIKVEPPLTLDQIKANAFDLMDSAMANALEL